MRHILPLVVVVVLGPARLGWALGDEIFADGFEYGTRCAAWSATTEGGGPPCEEVVALPGGTLGMTLVYVPAGSFQMGSPAGERGR